MKTPNSNHRKQNLFDYAVSLQLPSKLLEVYKTNIATIEVGGNDGLRDFPLNTIKQNPNKIVTLS